MLNAALFEFLETRGCYMYQLNRILIFAEQFPEEHIFRLAANSGIVMKWKYWDRAQSRQDGGASTGQRALPLLPGHIITGIETNFRENIKELTQNVKCQLLGFGLGLFWSVCDAFDPNLDGY